MTITEIKKAINVHRSSQIFSLTVGDDKDLHLLASVGYGSIDATFAPDDDDAICHLLDVIDRLATDSVIDFGVQSFIKIS